MGLDCLQRFPALKAKCLCFDVISPQDGHMVNDPKSLMRGFSVTSSSRNERPPAAQSHSKTSEESVKHGSHETALAFSPGWARDRGETQLSMAGYGV